MKYILLVLLAIFSIANATNSSLAEPDHFIENDPGNADEAAWAARVGLCADDKFSRLNVGGSYEEAE